MLTSPPQHHEYSPPYSSLRSEEDSGLESLKTTHSDSGSFEYLLGEREHIIEHIGLSGPHLGSASVIT